MLKKVVNLTVILTLFIVSPSLGQKAYLKGRVIDSNNQPVQGAQVKLQKAKISQTTGTDGRFSLETALTQVLKSSMVSDMITFQNGILSVRMSGIQKPIHVDVFDVKGQKITSLVQELSGKGACESKILPDALPEAVYLVKLTLESSSSVFRIMNIKNHTYSLVGPELYFEQSFLKQANVMSGTILDSIEVSKNTYLTTKVAVKSYNTDLGDIVLKTDPANEEGLPPITGGQQANTTRYWDCCKPHCGWHSDMKMCDINGNAITDKNAKSGCDGGPAFQCMDYAPIEVNSKVSYGWAAFNNSGTNCGDCFQLDFQGSMAGKQMIVQVVNIGNGGQNAFDLLIPGGGVGAMNGCTRQWNNAPLGATYGGFMATCGKNKDCISGMCDKAFGNRPDLMRGCNWFLNWFQMADNPKVVFKKVTCPQKIKDISRIGN
jgi:hypothetical protein